MSHQPAPLSVTILNERGFSRTAAWSLDGSGMLCLSGSLPDQPGVYAFVAGNSAMYVGLASRSLARRIYLYAKPGPTQITNIRLNALLTEMLTGGGQIDLYTTTPPDLQWNGWTISGPEGLEAGIIRQFVLPWNIRGSTAQTRVVARLPDPAPEDAVRPPSGTFVGDAGSSYGDRYRPLREHLSQCGKDHVSMTFREIELLVGKLPRSASLHRAWWANHEGNSQAKGWMPARYLAEPDPAHRSVIFRRFSY